MEDTARQIAMWRDEALGPVCVRISAGAWTALDLAERLSEYWTPQAIWLPEFMYCDLDLDIARREVDIGVRNRRPTHPWLAGRRTGRVEHAVFARNDTITGWIGPSDDTSTLPSEAWTLAHHGADIVAFSNDPQVRGALACAGVGRVVLPTFAGDMMPELTRVSGIIDELTSEEWLVCHQDTRHDPPIRAALDALAGIRARTG